MSKQSNYFIIVLLVFISVVEPKNQRNFQDSLPQYNFDLDILTQSQIEVIKNYTLIKNNFQNLSSLKKFKIPYQINNAEYMGNVGAIPFPFYIGAAFIFFIIILFFVTRFCFGKCIGPVTLKQITKFYRNVTWTLFLISTIGVIVTTIFLLISNNKVNSKFSNTIEYLNTGFNEINQTANYLVQNLKNININKSAPIIPDYLFDNFTDGVNNYIVTKRNNFGKVKLFSRLRTGGDIFFVIILYLSIISCLIYVKLRKPQPVLMISCVVLMTLPFILVFAGLNFSDFYLTSDLCDGLYDAAYSKRYPIYGIGIGNLISKYDNQTSASIYSIRYLFNTAQEKNTLNLTNEMLNDIQNKLNNFTQSGHIFPQVTYALKNYCPEAGTWILEGNTLIYISLLLITFVFAVSINKVKPLVLKQKLEIESMMMMNDEYE